MIQHLPTDPGPSPYDSAPAYRPAPGPSPYDSAPAYRPSLSSSPYDSAPAYRPAPGPSPYDSASASKVKAYEMTTPSYKTEASGYSDKSGGEAGMGGNYKMDIGDFSPKASRGDIINSKFVAIPITA